MTELGNPRVEQHAEETTIRIEVDLDRASVYGLKPGDVRRATATLVGGLTVGGVFEHQKVFDVVVWGAPEIRDSFNRIENLMIYIEHRPAGPPVGGGTGAHGARRLYHPAAGRVAADRGRG